MGIKLQPFVAATLAVALLAACGERAEENTATAPAAEQNAQPPEPSTASGTTTTFEESTPEPQQPPAE